VERRSPNNYLDFNEDLFDKPPRQQKRRLANDDEDEFKGIKLKVSPFCGKLYLELYLEWK
jgi:hypothetical protein